MPKPINVSDAQALRKEMKNALDKAANTRGSRRKRQAQDYEDLLKTLMKKIADLIA